MKLLITGANGQVGWEIIQRAKKLGIDFCPLNHAQLDITDKSAVAKVVTEYSPDYLVNAAAYTAVDKAENKADLAFAVNAQGASNLAMICHQHSIPLVHISTDYIFDGTKQGEYTEQDLPRPINVYGRTKWQGEQAIKENCSRHIILRTSWVFGVHGHNFVKTMLSLAKQRDHLDIVNDQYGGPTSASAIADVILAMIKKIDSSNQSYWGVYHFSGAPYVSWFEFAREIFDRAADLTGIPIPELQGVATESYPTRAKRPANSRLGCSKIKDVFDINPANWKASVIEIINANT